VKYLTPRSPSARIWFVAASGGARSALFSQHGASRPPPPRLARPWGRPCARVAFAAQRPHPRSALADGTRLDSWLNLDFSGESVGSWDEEPRFSVVRLRGEGGRFAGSRRLPLGADLQAT